MPDEVIYPIDTPPTDQWRRFAEVLAVTATIAGPEVGVFVERHDGDPGSRLQ
jgi:hypothetical protein